MPLIYSDGWLLVLVVCGGAVLLSIEIAEHTTLAGLLEVVSSNREYLGRVVHSCDGSCRTRAFTRWIPSSTNSILLLIRWQICEIYTHHARSRACCGALAPFTYTPIRAGTNRKPPNHGVQRVLSNSASAQVTVLCCCLAFFLYTAFNSFKFAFIN